MCPDRCLAALQAFLEGFLGALSADPFSGVVADIEQNPLPMHRSSSLRSRTTSSSKMNLVWDMVQLHLGIRIKTESATTGMHLATPDKRHVARHHGHIQHVGTQGQLCNVSDRFGNVLYIKHGFRCDRSVSLQYAACHTLG